MLHYSYLTFILMLIPGYYSTAVLEQGKPRLIGGPCEGCEGVLEYRNELTPADTLPDFREDGPKLKITGVIYEADGKRPAQNVVLYIYHTNQDGVYPVRGDETGWGKRHGYLRGWIRTNLKGEYTFYTLVPGSYPDRTSPSHIHPIILEPDGKYYYIEDFLFKGDSLLREEEINKAKPRGGPGYLLNPVLENDIWVARRDIILGKNVPGYE